MALSDVSSRSAATTALYLIFRIEADYYALAASEIEMVLKQQSLKKLPGAPAWVAGLLHIDGQIVPVIDIYQRILQRPASAQSSTRIVIVNYDNDKLLGLLLEKVNTFERLNINGWMDATIQLYNTDFLASVQQHASLGLIQNIELSLLLPEDIQQLLFQNVQQSPAPATEQQSGPTP